MNTYDVLLSTIPHRHEKLCLLLAELDRQWLTLARFDPRWQRGTRVLVYQDNLEHSYRHKNQALMEASDADYVSWLDDDDWLAPDYLAVMMAALHSRPDYVGFRVHWTVDGVAQVPVEHSLRHAGWVNAPDLLTRDVEAKNPIRRELALLGNWESFPQDHGADRHWASQVAPHCQDEVFIPGVMYYYRFSSTDSFLCPKQPWPQPLPELPTYPWLVAL